MYERTKYLPCGENALVVEFGNEISTEINAKIRKLILAIEKEAWEGIVEMTPTYRSLLVQYDPFLWSYSALVEKIESIPLQSDGESEEEVRLIEIPTLYADEFGLDMAFVAEHTHLSPEEIIRRHSARDYLVYMLGFIPGFTYLGGMDESLATPRLASPRLQILPGSVGIAGSQTGIYPSVSPGGWQIIGRTPLKLYDAMKNPPVFIQAGDYIRYIPISRADYDRIEEEVAKGTYQVKIRNISRGELHVK